MQTASSSPVKHYKSNERHRLDALGGHVFLCFFLCILVLDNPRTAVYNKDKERRYPCKRLAPHQFKSLQKVMTATELGNCGRSFLFVLFPVAAIRIILFRSSIKCTTLTRSANSAMIVWKSNRISDVVIRHPSLRCERREQNSKKLPSRACFAPKSKTARPVRSNSRLRLAGQRLSAKRIP